MKTTSSAPASPLDLGRQDIANPQIKLLRNVHETFARELGAGLSTYLPTEITANLTEVGFVEAAEFRKTLPSPSCLISLKLFPRQERMILHFDLPTVLGLLELLLGGSGSAQAGVSRELTEIEWTLLEEVVRIVARTLGAAWQPIAAVEFVVESLSSDPTALPLPDSAPAHLRAGFHLQWGEQTGSFQFAVPRALFEAAQPPADQQEAPEAQPDEADFTRNLGLLENALVEFEVRLQGPTLAVTEILALKAGQVITFDHSLHKSLHGVVNGDVAADLAIRGHIVGAGRKRAFQVEQLP